VYGHDAEARERGLTPDERLRFHQERSRPVMDKLHAWLEAQLAERRTEPNSGLSSSLGHDTAKFSALDFSLSTGSRGEKAVQSSIHYGI